MSYPEVMKIPVTSKHDFIVVASDGLWDCYKYQQAADYIRGRRGKRTEHSESEKN